MEQVRYVSTGRHSPSNPDRSLSSVDSDRVGIADGKTIRVQSRRGEVNVTANMTPEVPEGMVWMTFHFRDGNANWLTHAALDPITLTAEYKAYAVRIEKI